MTNKKYIGLDVHQATISVAVMDASGKLVIESILETKASTLVSGASLTTVAGAGRSRHIRGA